MVRGRLPGPAWWRVVDADTTVWVLGVPSLAPRRMQWDRAVFERRLQGANVVILPFVNVRAKVGGSIGTAFNLLRVRAGGPFEAKLDPGTRARFVAVRTRPSRDSNTSLCSLPRIRAPATPRPSSKPLVAGSESIALARSASRRSNTGSPSPAGTPRTRHSITPPTESPALRTALMRSIIFSAVARCGHRTAVASTSASVGNALKAPAGTTRSCTSVRKARISRPPGAAPVARPSAKIFFAIAPAATRPTVSRAELRPPPRWSRTPNFVW